MFDLGIAYFYSRQIFNPDLFRPHVDKIPHFRYSVNRSMVQRKKQKFHIPFIIISLIAAISLAVNFFLVKERKNYNQVTEVVDGDTFQLRSGKRVRLMGIDAPEFDRCGGSQAKERLTELIMGKNVILKEETEEAFGRSLSLVYKGG